jgi:hypothetical protein
MVDVQHIIAALLTLAVALMGVVVKLLWGVLSELKELREKLSDKISRPECDKELGAVWEAINKHRHAPDGGVIR